LLFQCSTVIRHGAASFREPSRSVYADRSVFQPEYTAELSPGRNARDPLDKNVKAISRHIVFATPIVRAFMES